MILLGLRRVIQVVLPLGSGGTPVQVQVLSPAPITKESLFVTLLLFMGTIIGLEPALGEAEHNRVFARYLRMMGRAHQVLSPAPITKEAHFVTLLLFMGTIIGLEPALAEGEHNRAFARYLRMMGRAHQVLSPAPNVIPLLIQFTSVVILLFYNEKLNSNPIYYIHKISITLSE